MSFRVPAFGFGFARKGTGLTDSKSPISVISNSAIRDNTLSLCPLPSTLTSNVAVEVLPKAEIHQLTSQGTATAATSSTNMPAESGIPKPKVSLIQTPSPNLINSLRESNKVGEASEFTATTISSHNNILQLQRKPSFQFSSGKSTRPSNLHPVVNVNININSSDASEATHAVDSVSLKTGNASSIASSNVVVGLPIATHAYGYCSLPKACIPSTNGRSAGPSSNSTVSHRTPPRKPPRSSRQNNVPQLETTPKRKRN